MDQAREAYDRAAGRCLDAMQSMRRSSGTEAIEELKAAIRMIEDEQRRAKRQARLDQARIRVAPIEPPPAPADYPF